MMTLSIVVNQRILAVAVIMITNRVSCAGLPAVTALPLMADDPDEAAPDPPYANIEWTIHPGCLPYFSAVLASAVICKTPGLIIDLEHEPKSRRLISIATNASPKLEAFILSVVSYVYLIVSYSSMKPYVPRPPLSSMY